MLVRKEALWRRASSVAFLAPFLLPFLLYLNTIPHDFALDDYVAVTENSLVQEGLRGIPSIFAHGYFFGQKGRDDESYRPLSLAMLAMEKDLGAGDPRIHHFFNVLWYSLGCLLLYSVLRAAFPKQWSSYALAAALLFAAHPIHTEVVANIKSRDEILSFAFGMLALRLVHRSAERKELSSLAASALAYALALLSKESALTFVAVIPSFLYFSSSLRVATLLVRSIPFFLVAAGYLLLRALVLDSLTFQYQFSVFSNSLLGAKNAGEFIATNFLIHAKYLRLLLFPHPLSWDYSFNQIPIMTLSDPIPLVAIATFAVLFFLGLRGIKDRSWVSFGILFYLVTISVVSNFFVTLGTTMAERFVFVPSVGYCIVLALSAKSFIERFPRHAAGGVFASLALVLVLAGYSFKTIVRNKDWKNDLTICSSGVRASPNSARAHMALGDVYRIQLQDSASPGLQPELARRAADAYAKSLQIYSNNLQVLYSLGYVHFIAGDMRSAEAVFTAGLAIERGHIWMRHYRAVAMSRLGKLDEAVAEFREVIAANPTFLPAHLGLASAYLEKKDTESSINAYRSALRFAPKSDAALAGLAEAYERLGELVEATSYYRHALQASPGNQAALAGLRRVSGSSPRR